MSRHIVTCVLGAAIAFGAPSTLSPAKGARIDVTADALLAAVYDEIVRGHVDVALQNIEGLIRVKPNFRLAHLIKGDLLLARARPISTIGAAPNVPEASMEGLRAEALARLRAYREPPPEDRVPRYLLQLRQDQKYAIVVDTHRSRLYLYENDEGKPRFVADYYVSSGKNGPLKLREGDEKTPIGVYHVTESLPREKLSDFYGNGAFPINYPNEWDRIKGRNGHGIWLHGTPSNTYSRPPRSSNGCVVLANSDLDVIARNLQVGLTPVIISEDVEWLSTDDWTSERQSFAEQLERWRADWESLDTERYLAHYSKKFSAPNQDLESWSRHKRLVNSGKTWVKVKVGNLSIFRDPGKEDLLLVSFDQEYRSNNLSNTVKKVQYWLREDGYWHIVYEGTA
ncbi:MAG TPA: L,D-transpeptidase family protein [Burkholderiales bacterium]|nr:L,D-transpeptidase family protein [Burkholderiales bacterium]